MIPTAAELAGLDLGTIERVWRDRFSNASDWVFAFSGDFDIDVASDLARRYIGTLSGTGATERYKDFQIDPPSTIVTKEVHAGTGDKGSLTFDWDAEMPSPSGDGLRRPAHQCSQHPVDRSHPRGARCFVLSVGVSWDPH